MCATFRSHWITVELGHLVRTFTFRERNYYQYTTIAWVEHNAPGNSFVIISFGFKVVNRPWYRPAVYVWYTARGGGPWIRDYRLSVSLSVRWKNVFDIFVTLCNSIACTLPPSPVVCVYKLILFMTRKKPSISVDDRYIFTDNIFALMPLLKTISYPHVWPNSFRVSGKLLLQYLWRKPLEAFRTIAWTLSDAETDHKVFTF